MTRRRSLVAALAFIALVGVLLIPTASEARTSRARIIGVTTTTIAAAPVGQTAQAAGGPTPVVAAGIVGPFIFPGFTIGNIIVPAITIPAVDIPEPAATFVSSLLSTLFGSGPGSLSGLLCSVFGATFCAS